jgi:mRNA interferase MazF
MRPARGDVWLADLGIAGKSRPVIVISRNDADAPRTLIVFVPVTSVVGSSRYEVDLKGVNCVDAGSHANAQGIASLPSKRFEHRKGIVPTEVFKRVVEAVLYTIGVSD